MLQTPAELAAGPARRPRPARAAGGAEHAAAASFGAALGALRRHRGALVLCVVAIPALAAIALHQITPRYTASGAVIYEPSSYALQELQSILRADPTTDTVVASQAEILRSKGIAERVTDRLGLTADPAFNAALRPPSALRRLLAPLWPIGPAPETDRQAVVQAVQDAIWVLAVRASRVLDVSFTARDPKLAAEAANLVMELYIADQLQGKFDAVRRAGLWLETRVGELRAEVRQSEDRIAAYRAREGLVQGVQAGLDTERISRLTADLVQARNDLGQAEARVDQARGRAGSAGATAAISPSVVALRAQEDQLNAQLQSLATRLGPGHPDVASLRNQLVDIRRSVAAETARVVAAGEAETRALRARIATLDAQLRDAQETIDRNAQAMVPLNAMQREADAARTLLQAVLERVQQTAQQTAIEKPDARVISVAMPPGAPSYPRTVPMLAAAVAFAVFLGLLLVYVLELSDRTFRSGEDLRAVLGVPGLALIPQLGRRQLGRLRAVDYAVQRPFSPFAEQLRALRAALWLGASQPKVVAITAARPGEGKTTVALSLARCAALSGERVMVLDCDVRQPGIGTLLGVQHGAGLVDYLQGRAALADIVRRDPESGLDALTTGAVDAGSLGLFVADGMQALLRQLRETYTLVVLDAPPAIAMADARIVARLADATLLCVRWRDTPHSVVRNAVDLLEDAGATVIGAVLTRVDAGVHVRSGFPDAEIYHPRYGGYFKE